MAYVLGFFAADGCITVNPQGGEYFVIQIGDLDLLKKLRKSLGSDHKISKRLHLKYKSTFFRLQIGSKEICDDLRKLGFSENKTHCLVLPKIPNQYFKDFVKGYFDGDGNVWVGYIHKDRPKKMLAIRTVFTSCSKEFLEILKAKLEKRKIFNGVLSKGKGNYYRLTYSIHGSLKLYDFMYNHNVRTANKLFLERKRKRFEEYIKKRS